MNLTYYTWTAEAFLEKALYRLVLVLNKYIFTTSERKENLCSYSLVATWSRFEWCGLHRYDRLVNLVPSLCWGEDHSISVSMAELTTGSRLIAVNSAPLSVHNTAVGTDVP